MTMSYDNGNFSPASETETAHLSYSLDQIQSLINQAAGIAVQDNLPLLGDMLSCFSQWVDKFRS